MIFGNNVITPQTPVELHWKPVGGGGGGGWIDGGSEATLISGLTTCGL